MNYWRKLYDKGWLCSSSQYKYFFKPSQADLRVGLKSRKWAEEQLRNCCQMEKPIPALSLGRECLTDNSLLVDLFSFITYQRDQRLCLSVSLLQWKSVKRFDGVIQILEKYDYKIIKPSLCKPYQIY